MPCSLLDIGTFFSNFCSTRISTIIFHDNTLPLHITLLMQILGSGMSARMWEVTVDHARTCFLGDEVQVYYPNGARKTGFVFNVVGEALGTYSEQQFIPLADLQNNAKVRISLIRVPTLNISLTCLCLY